MNTGRIIKSIRVAAGLNQKDFAVKLNISPSTLCLYETGEREPSLSFLKALSDKLRIPLAVFLAENGETPTGLTPEQAEEYEWTQEMLTKILTSLVRERLKFDDTREAANA